MRFENFSISAIPYINDAVCECGGDLKQVSNGLFSVAMFCPKCENVYEIKLVKAHKRDINEDFLIQARNESK